MAHKKREKSRDIIRRREDTHPLKETRGRLPTARPNLGRRFRLSDLLHNTIKPIQTRLQEVEDLRRIPHEFRQKGYLLRSGVPAPVRYDTISARVYGKMFTSVHPYFQYPERTVVCIRRQERRRVLFSLQKTGKGGRRNRPPKWTAKSYIRCR